MGELSRDALLGATTLPTETIEIPELGGSVTVTGMSAADRDAFEASLVLKHGKQPKMQSKNVRARLLVRTVIQDGKRMFADEDVPLVGRIRADIVDRLFDAAMRLSGMSDADVEELGKASPADQPGDSVSPSPGN